MTVVTTKFVRKALYVDAIRVTEENFEQVSEWCKGNIVNGDTSKYIKVHVQSPLSEKQTRAWCGDWVLHGPNGYKVYTNKSFNRAFMSVEEKQQDEIQYNATADWSGVESVTPLVETPGSDPSGGDN